MLQGKYSRQTNLETLALAVILALATSLAFGGNKRRRLCTEHEEVSDISYMYTICSGR